MMNLGDLAEDQAVNFDFHTTDATGAPITLAGSPVVSVYKDDATGTEKTSAEAYITLTIDFDGITGTHHVKIDTSGDAFFATGADYTVRITTGTVDSVDVAGYVLAAFSIQNRYNVANAAIEDHDVQGTFGWAVALMVYMGGHGPGIWIDSGAANTNTAVGTDGTAINPVSTFAAARTIADALGLTCYYIGGNSDITLAAAHVDWLFVGMGEPTANVLNCDGQQIDRSKFIGLTLEGDCQFSGSGERILAVDCALQDPGAGVSTFHIFACRCGIVDDITIDTSSDNVFDQCFSLVAGTGAPKITASGAAGTVAVRHNSGGIEFASLSASHNVSVETDGQVIFAASCNVNANVSLRGNMTVTDNTAGMNSLTDGAVYNVDAVNAEMVDVMSVDTVSLPGQEAPPLTPTRDEMDSWLYKFLRNKQTVTINNVKVFADNESTVDHQYLLNDDDVTFTKSEVISGP